MSAPKWTPGPWIQRGSMWIEGADGEPIARVYIKPVRNLKVKIPREENAALIAAAPELYAALELAVATIERLTVRHGPFSSTDGTLEVARAALGKAVRS